MKLLALLKSLGLATACSLFVLSMPSWAESEPADNAVSNSVQTTADETASAEVDSEANQQAAERRKQILKEAVDALAQSNKALKALDEGKTEDALNALALATGKLELIVARDPELALAPTDVRIARHDVIASSDALKAAIKEAENALDDGDIQQARYLLSRLGSELIITVENLPLATYPDAIKAISPLIDDGQIEEAKAQLQAALSTVVLVDHVVPLPMIRAEALLANAEKLTEKDDRTEDENVQLTDDLAAARDQLEMAQLLGYADKKSIKELKKQIESIEEKTEDGQSGKGFFDKLKDSFSKAFD